MAANDDFPGLNKRHGFFRAIERNQMNRDEYHREQKERKEVQRVEVKQEWQRERKPRKRPDKAIYQPPRGKGRERERERGEQYSLKVEVAPGHWHTQEIEPGSVEAVASEIAQRYSLEEDYERALVSLMEEFEMTK